jgi:signal transduction histidine kinase
MVAQSRREVPAAEASPSEVEILRRQIMALQRVSSLGVLAGSICHELNNALTPIVNYAKLGLRNPDPEFHRRAFERIQEAAQRASGITGGVLGLTRPRADRREPTDLVRLAEDVVLLTAKDLTKHRIRLDFQKEGRPHARVNPAQIQQVLLNLIINARQAMTEGGTVGLRVALDPAGRLAELSVSDTGVGIAQKDLRRIFEPFFTTKTGPDELGLGGTGLGLPVCRDIVEAHRGRIRVESRLGQGSTFTLRLPACPPPQSTKDVDSTKDVA